MTTVKIQAALADLVAAGTTASEMSPADIVADAAVLAAAVSVSSPGASLAWADAFSLPVHEFSTAAARGSTYNRQASHVLAQLISQHSSAIVPYAYALAELATESASLGELTIRALGEATIVGNTQLRYAGVPLSNAHIIGQVPILPTQSGVSGPASSSTTSTPTQTAPTPAPLADEPAVVPEPARPLTDLLEELDALVGLNNIKEEVRQQAQVLRIQKIRETKGLRSPGMTRHLVFTGNPGTGKTTVARLVAAIYRAIGLLEKGHLVECDSSKLVAGYVGQTALKTAELIEQAIDGVLFIDEAYSLATNEYGEEAINTLVKAMEDHRDELVVIVAGYPGPMKKFIMSNPGFKSRFRLTLQFDDYSDDELVEIFERACADADFTPGAGAITRLREILVLTVREEGFGNGRFVRNVFEDAVVNQAWRLRDEPDPDVEALRSLCAEDIQDNSTITPLEPPASVAFDYVATPDVTISTSPSLLPDATRSSTIAPTENSRPSPLET